MSLANALCHAILYFLGFGWFLCVFFFSSIKIQYSVENGSAISRYNVNNSKGACKHNWFALVVLSVLWYGSQHDYAIHHYPAQNVAIVAEKLDAQHQSEVHKWGKHRRMQALIQREKRKRHSSTRMSHSSSYARPLHTATSSERERNVLIRSPQQIWKLSWLTCAEMCHIE